jgi:hypothetical protein
VGERSHGCRPQIKPGSRGPIQRGWASTASPPPDGPAQCPILDYSRPIRVNGGSGPPFLLAPAPSDLERAVMEGGGGSTPTEGTVSKARHLRWIVVAFILELMVLVWAASRNRRPARGSDAITDR